ncbi:MAG: hypothetical protein LBG72_04395 [Spirochaetaceae bacterium]|jgi:hypothetical protein|nr:hypothetical protein [Spirochaetaceae bacterium]
MERHNSIDKQRYYSELIKKYETGTAAFLKNETEILNICRQEPATAACKLFKLAEDALNAASLYVVISNLNNVVFGLKNEESLGEARKCLSKAIIYIENVVTNKIDALYSEYEASLAELAEIKQEEKLYVIRKIGLTIDIIKLAYGDVNRWKWAFVEIEGRFAAIAKNLLDLRKAQANESKNADYIHIANHVKLVKHLLDKTATRYIERYELSTKHASDILNAINFMSALERIKNLTGDTESMEIVRKKLDAWKIRYEFERKPQVKS